LAAHVVFSHLAVLVVLLGGDFFEHLGDCGSVLGIEVCIDLVEQVERCGIALLNCED
jgi:hypothetical protein